MPSIHTPNLFSIRSRASTVKYILGIGDSRTEQLPWQFVGYTSNRFNWVNWGISGFTTKQYRDFLVFDMANYSIGTPYGAVINLGINDVWDGECTPDWYAFEANYNDIIYWFASRGMHVAVCTPTPLESGYQSQGINAAAYTASVDHISDRIRAIALAATVPVIDYNYQQRQTDHTAIAGITLDGCHLSTAGVASHWGIITPVVSTYFV